jgi:4-amino-4-deoxyprephenate dehydrogenase
MTPRCAVVAGGRGAVGAMLTGLLRGSGVPTTVIDLHPGDHGSITGDITKPDATVAETVGRADLVVLAIPEPVALRALDPLAGLVRPGAVLADTLSVKSRFAARLAGFPAGIEQVGINPMFAPDLGMAGHTVAAVVTRGGPGATALLQLVESWGGRVVRCTPEEHDRTAAATQALTHAAVLSFGLALAHMGTDADQLADTAPPPHLAMLALLARVTGSSPEVYWDIQQANPYAAPARQALAEGLGTLAAAVESGEARMAAVFDDLRALLGTGFEEHRQRARELLTATHPQAEVQPMTQQDSLEGLREQLDRVDQELLDTIHRRMECGVRIAQYKAANAVPVMQPGRVTLVKERAARFGSERGVDPAFLIELYELIINEMCRVEDLVIAQAEERAG